MSNKERRVYANRRVESLSQSLVKVGLLGLGTVGSGVVKLLQQDAHGVEIKKILVRDLNKERAVDVQR